MTETKSDLINYSSRCVTCNFADNVLADIHKWHRSGVNYRQISTMLMRTHEIPLSDDAVANHLQKHSKTETTLQPLLGVVKPPKGFEAGYQMDGDSGEATSKPQTSDKITDFSQILDELGIDSNEFEVDGSARMSKWQTFYGDWLTAYRFRFKKKVSTTDIDDLVTMISDVRASPVLQEPSNPYAFVFAAGDLQLGKSDTDGTVGIVTRYMASLQKAVNKYDELARAGLAGPILISWVGDCIEGMVSQGGKNARRTELTTTQQVKLLRQLMTATIKAFAPMTNELRVVSVPGNHDEAQREPVSTDFSDSWAVDALVAVSEALTFNPEAFGHVTCEVVPFDELTSTIEICGSKITHAHGHQWRPGKHWDWFKGQHWGGHAPGEADILLSGHMHTGVYEQQNFKHFIRTPSFEKESTYFRHRTGLVGNPSAVTFLTRDGKIKYLDYE